MGGRVFNDFDGSTVAALGTSPAGDCAEDVEGGVRACCRFGFDEEVIAVARRKWTKAKRTMVSDLFYNIQAALPLALQLLPFMVSLPKPLSVLLLKFCRRLNTLGPENVHFGTIVVGRVCCKRQGFLEVVESVDKDDRDLVR